MHGYIFTVFVLLLLLLIVIQVRCKSLHLLQFLSLRNDGVPCIGNQVLTSVDSMEKIRIGRKVS